MAIGKGSLMGTRRLLGRAMRRNLNHFLHSKYVCLSGLRAVYQKGEALDSQDQRITEDVERFTIGLLEIIEVIILSPILILFYTVQVSSKLNFTSISIIYAHFLLSILVLRFGIEKLKKLTAEKEKREANFRNEHVALKVSLESFVIVNSESLLSNLKSALNSQLKKLLFTSKQLIVTESLFETVKTFFSYSGALLNFLLMAAELTWGRWRDESDSAIIAESISMTSFISLYLIYQLSKLAGVTDMIGSLNGRVARLSLLLQVLENSEDSVNSEINIEDTHISQDTDTLLQLDNFTGSTKDHRILYENFNLKIDSGQNVLIVGPNGAGKTSLLRFLTGLWPQSGAKCKITRFMACPQSFVLFSGSLYDLLGIVSESNGSDEESKIGSIAMSVREILELVGLDSNAIEPFDLPRSITTWQSILTPGQHQRLALARVLLHQPLLLALDETFAAIPAEEAEIILKEFVKRKVTVILLDPKGDFTPEGFFKHTINIGNKT